MAFTSENLAAIDRAIASGELRVTVNGRTVEYRSMADLLKARSTIVAEQAASTTGRRGGSFRYTFTTLRGE